MSRYIPVAFTALLLVSACGDPRSEGPRTTDGSPPSQLASDYEFEAFPGSTWYGPNGEEISEESNIINAITGPEHCEWESAVMMHVGWPLGRDAEDISESRQYMRDPEEVLPQENLMAEFDDDVELPKTAKYTGYRTEFMELWLDHNDRAAAYLTFSDHVERWPRASDTIACA